MIFAAAQREDVAGLCIERLARRLVLPLVADFGDHRITGIVKRVWNRAEVVPFGTDSHKELLRDLVVPDPCLATWLVGVPFRFAPRNLRIQRAYHGGNVPRSNAAYTSFTM